jgi:hypothetical protein
MENLWKFLREKVDDLQAKLLWESGFWRTQWLMLKHWWYMRKLRKIEKRLKKEREVENDF